MRCGLLLSRATRYSSKPACCPARHNRARPWSGRRQSGCWSSRRCRWCSAAVELGRSDQQDMMVQTRQPFTAPAAGAPMQSRGGRIRHRRGQGSACSPSDRPLRRAVARDPLRTRRNQKFRRVPTRKATRESAAAAIGLWEHQRKTALAHQKPAARQFRTLPLGRNALVARFMYFCCPRTPIGPFPDLSYLVSR